MSTGCNIYIKNKKDEYSIQFETWNYEYFKYKGVKE